MQGWHFFQPKMGSKMVGQGCPDKIKQVGLFRRILLFDRCRAFFVPHRRHQDLIWGCVRSAHHFGGFLYDLQAFCFRSLSTIYRSAVSGLSAIYSSFLVGLSTIDKSAFLGLYTIYRSFVGGLCKIYRSMFRGLSTIYRSLLQVYARSTGHFGGSIHDLQVRVWALSTI